METEGLVLDLQTIEKLREDFRKLSSVRFRTSSMLMTALSRLQKHGKMITS